MGKYGYTGIQRGRRAWDSGFGDNDWTIPISCGPEGQTGVYRNHVGIHRGLDEWKSKWTYRIIWGVRSAWV